MFEEYNLSIIPLTPIHVGTGDAMCPGEYFVFGSSPNVVYVCDLASVPDEELGPWRDLLLRWVTENPLTWPANVATHSGMSQFIKKHASRQCKTTKECFEQITKRWGKGMSELAISTIYRTLHGPVIPGSTMKGALRTALLYERFTKPSKPIKRNDSRDAMRWERQILFPGSSGEIKDDFMSALKVSDSQAVKVTTWVVQPKHIGMAKEAQEMQDYMECLPPAKLDNPYRIRLTVSIATRVLQLRGKPHAITMDEIMEACRLFYGKVLEEEITYWSHANTQYHKNALKKCEEIKEIAQKHNAGALIRLGRGCGMNSLSVNIAKPRSKFRSLRTDPEYRYDPRTRVLLGGMPPGWALLNVEATKTNASRH